MNLHLDLAEAILDGFGEQLAEPVDVKQDALLVRLENGVLLTIRYAARDAYALRWTWGDAELAIDTAPVHAALDTRPNHLHRADGTVAADPLTHCGADPWDNVRVVIEALLRDPLDPAPAA